MTHDEHVVRLFERDALLDHQAAHARAAVVAEMPVQLLDPRLGREDERDLGFARHSDPVDVGGARRANERDRARFPAPMRSGPPRRGRRRA